MKRFSLTTSVVAALGIAAVAVTATPQKASAGLLDAIFGSGGGGGSWNTSGRRMVSFSKRYKAGQIIVSFSDRRLYYVVGQGKAISYPIGVPAGRARWSGVLRVSRKAVNPGWTPTPSMRRENPTLPAHVPGGHPRNPLGVRALYLGNTLYRIHGTDAPWTVGRDVTHGCIRLYNRDVIDLYNRVRVGTRVTITYQRFRAI